MPKDTKRRRILKQNKRGISECERGMHGLNIISLHSSFSFSFNGIFHSLSLYARLYSVCECVSVKLSTWREALKQSPGIIMKKIALCHNLLKKDF